MKKMGKLIPNDTVHVIGVFSNIERVSILDYKVVCDESNNSEEDKNNQMLRADIYITLVPTINEIVCKFEIKEKL